MLKRFQGPRGRVQFFEFQSECLKSNALGDPSLRKLPVYLPAAYDSSPDRHFPVLVDIVGFTGSGLSHIAWRNFSENLPERLDRLIHSGKMDPTIVVFPDCFTSLGGNQYIDSSALGPYAHYLTQEIVPFIDSQLRTKAGRKHRGIFGKSSGGYGSLIHGMKYADTWNAIACHSGDLYFDFCYGADLPKCLNVLAKHDRSVEQFLTDFHEMAKPSNDDIHTLMYIAMAASYDPDPEAPLGFHMPCDLYTGEMKPQRWKNWLANDPIHILEQYSNNLRSLALLYIDCGSRDQYHLHYGARIFKNKLEAMSIKHVYEEFDDDHSSIDYRMDTSLPLLSKAIA